MRKRVQAVDFKAGKPTRWQAYDTFAFTVATDASERVMTREGFMKVPAHIARTGIQEYGAMELGLEGTARTIRLLRPADEVFKAESYATFERQTLTSNHPDGDVTAGNYRQVSVGDVHDVTPNADGAHLDATLLFKASDAIEMVVFYGKNQLSCGYSFVLDMTPGTTPDGQAYDGVMREIIGNHVALVWEARGGPGLRVADTTNRRTSMHTITINGITFQVADATQASLIEREIKTLTEARDGALKAKETAEGQAKADAAALKAATDAATAAKTAHDAALAEANGKILTAEAVDALVDEKIKATDGAKAIVGDSFDGAGKTVAAIHVEVLTHVAKDDASFPGVLAVLDGVEPDKAPANIAKAAFGAAVAVKASGAGDRRATGDSKAGRAFAPDSKTGSGNGNARVIKYADNVHLGVDAQSKASA